MSVLTLAKQNSTATIDNRVTLQRLRTLEHLYEQGFQDDVIDLTIQKLLEHQVQQDKAQLNQLKLELTKFEQQFGLSSEDFMQQYQAGQMGDDIDVFEWHVLYKMYARLREQLAVFQDNLASSPGDSNTDRC
jgi:hypothetical protein